MSPTTQIIEEKFAESRRASIDRHNASVLQDRRRRRRRENIIVVFFALFIIGVIVGLGFVFLGAVAAIYA